MNSSARRGYVYPRIAPGFARFSSYNPSVLQGKNLYGNRLPSRHGQVKKSPRFAPHFSPPNRYLAPAPVAGVIFVPLIHRWVRVSVLSPFVIVMKPPLSHLPSSVEGAVEWACPERSRMGANLNFTIQNSMFDIRVSRRPAPSVRPVQLVQPVRFVRPLLHITSNSPILTSSFDILNSVF